VRFATAIRDNDALTLKESLRNIDILVIDDMQFLQGKLIQHEFCHLLTCCSTRQAGRGRSRRAPWELESLDPRVRSRLQGGVAIEMDAPDFDMRLECSSCVSIRPSTKTRALIFHRRFSSTWDQYHRIGP